MSNTQNFNVDKDQINSLIKKGSLFLEDTKSGIMLNYEDYWSNKRGEKFLKDQLTSIYFILDKPSKEKQKQIMEVLENILLYKN